jgi:hypothetical protein
MLILGYLALTDQFIFFLRYYFVIGFAGREHQDPTEIIGLRYLLILFAGVILLHFTSLVRFFVLCSLLVCIAHALLGSCTLLNMYKQTAFIMS